MTIYDCNTTFYSFSSDLDCKSLSPFRTMSSDPGNMIIMLNLILTMILNGLNDYCSYIYYVVHYVEPGYPGFVL